MGTGVFQPAVFQGTVFQMGAAVPPDRDLIILTDSSGAGVGIFPAQVKWIDRLLGADTLDSVTIPWKFTKPDGTTESRASQVDNGWYCLWKSKRYIVEEPDTDNETGIEFKAVSAETELANFYTNYSAGPATYLNVLPSELYAAVLSGKVGRQIRNPGFGILDATSLPTNWSHPAGWASATVSNRRVWQADAGTDESYSDDMPCTPGVSYRVKLDIMGTSATGTRGVLIRWIKADGTTVDSATTNATVEDGTFNEVDTGDIVALGTRMRIVLVTSGTAATSQFDDVRLYEIGPNTGWTVVGTAMDARSATISHTDGALEKYGVWTAGGGPPTTYIESTAVGDYVGRVINGPFVTINWIAGGAGSTAKVRINGVQYQQSGATLVPGTAAIDTSGALSLTCSGLDPTNDHIVEVEVGAVKTRLGSLTVSTANLLSMRWDWKTVYEAIVSIREATGGELAFDTVTMTVTPTAAIGQNLKTNNIVEFRRGQNIVKMQKTEGRSKLVNRLTGLGYGEGQYQLVVTVDATGTDAVSGLTSIATYGVQRGTYTEKECKSLATMTTTLQRLVEQSCWYRNAYTPEVTRAAADLCVPGDTGYFVYGDINESLRILEISRSTESSAASLKVANIAEDLTDKLESTRKELATLNKSYQGVPTDTNDTFWDQFERTAGGSDVSADIDFFIPYGADLIDLRLRYQVDGMRAFAKGISSGAGATSGSGGGETSGGGGGYGGAGGTFTTSPSASAATSSATSTGGTQQNYFCMTGPPLDETDATYPFTAKNDTGAEDPTMTDARGASTHSHSFAHTHGLHQHAHEFDWSEQSGALPNHCHTVSAHTHSISIGNHSHYAGDHTHGTSAHVHSVSAHTHSLSYGINTSSPPATVRVYLDDLLITALNDLTSVSDFDLMPYTAKDSNGRVQEGWRTLSFKTATNGATGRVRGTVFAQKFLATEGL